MKSNEITLEKLQENLQTRFPDFGIHISEAGNTGEMEIIEVTISIPNQAEIVFHQIKNFFDEVEDGDSVELLENALVSITESNLSIYAKEDRKQILKDATSIVRMKDAEGTSFHKLKEHELKEKMKIYEIQEKEFTKEEE